MTFTDEYNLGWGALAENCGFTIHRKDSYASYELPGTWENGWIAETHPAEGLFAASAWFTTEEAISYTINSPHPFLWVLCIDNGSMKLSQRGKSATTLTPFTHLIVNEGKPIKITIPAGEHLCFTSVFIFGSFIDHFLTSNKMDYPIRISDAKNWKPRHIDTPLVMLVMEQIRWGVRGNRLPNPAYICKAIELLCLFAHRFDNEAHVRVRRKYVNWENEQKIYRVKERIDSDPLNRPTTAELCLLSEMCESKLRLSFKSLYGQTLYSYIKEAVMKRAMQKLADDCLNIKNIAAQCGYENPAKFAAAFKNVHGITPSQFRNGFGL